MIIWHGASYRIDSRLYYGGPCQMRTIKSYIPVTVFTLALVLSAQLLQPKLLCVGVLHCHSAWLSRHGDAWFVCLATC